MCSSFLILCGTFCTSWTWVTVSFFPWIFQLLAFQIFSKALHLSLLLGPLCCKCWCIYWCPRGLSDCLHFFSFFFLYSVSWQWFPPSFFQLNYPFFCFVYFINSFYCIFHFSYCILQLFACYLYFLTLCFQRRIRKHKVRKYK